MEDGTSCYGNRVIQFYVGQEVGGIRKKNFKDSYRNIFDRQVGISGIKIEEIVFYAKEGKCWKFLRRGKLRECDVIGANGKEHFKKESTALVECC